MTAVPLLPRLVGPAAAEADRLVVDRGDTTFELVLEPEQRDVVHGLLEGMDGTRDVRALAAAARIPDTAVEDLVAMLDRHCLVRDAAGATAVSGLDALFEIEDLTNDLLYATLYRNDYWRAITDPGAEVPPLVLHGTAVENYHFLLREAWFDAPVLSFPASRGVRAVLAEFFAEEDGHDELLLRAILALGPTREDVADTIPLRTTLALCNALAYWSRTDPLFFLTTLGVLEGKDVAVDSFVLACERHGLAESFVGPLRTHAEINLRGGHGNLAREVFARIAGVDRATLDRLLRRTRLFVSLYDQFYQGIWDHYATASTLLRRLADLPGGAR